MIDSPAEVVYIVYKDDGNVCCPASEVVMVCNSPAVAGAYCYKKNKLANTYPYSELQHYYEEMPIIKGLPYEG